MGYQMLQPGGDDSWLTWFDKHVGNTQIPCGLIDVVIMEITDSNDQGRTSRTGLFENVESVHGWQHQIENEDIGLQ